MSIFHLDYRYGFAESPRAPRMMPADCGWRHSDPGRPADPPSPVRYVSRMSSEWRPYEPCWDNESDARRERARLEERAEVEARAAAGLPCGRSVLRHVSARWRNYGPCVRRAGHPGFCSERA